MTIGRYTYTQLPIAQVLEGDTITFDTPEGKRSGQVQHIAPTRKGDNVRIHLGLGEPLIARKDMTVNVARLQ